MGFWGIKCANDVAMFVLACALHYCTNKVAVCNKDVLQSDWVVVCPTVGVVIVKVGTFAFAMQFDVVMLGLIHQPLAIGLGVLRQFEILFVIGNNFAILLRCNCVEFHR